MDEKQDESGQSQPADYFKKRPHLSADVGQPADPLPPALVEPPKQDQEFLTGYMSKLAKEQQIKKAKNSGIIYVPVGSIKFALLCLFVPFQGYFFWWLYKNFVYQKERNQNFRSPLWRVNLLLLYLRGLLNSMKDEGKLYGLEGDINVEKIIFYAVMLLLCAVLPPPASILGMFAFVPFIYVNEYLIKLNKVANPDIPISEKFSFSEWILLISGVAFLAFTNFYVPMLLTQMTQMIHM